MKTGRDEGRFLIGAAWPSKNGTGFNVTFNAHPIGNSIILRVPKEKVEKTEEMNDKIEY